ncbi:MAG: FAD-binding oxidoreductase, partial [Armatimonadetes bacterium]|nr:FAD-binding oxidoreductase [Armatimonadota bacterium]
MERALREAVRGEVRFDAFSRVLYSTDASIYQIMPVGVVIPRDEDDIAATLRIAAGERIA